MTFPTWSVVCLLVCLVVAVPFAAAKPPVNCETTELEAELVSCAKDELKRTESALEGMMRRVMRTVPASIHDALQNAQSAWNRYREAECAWNALDPETGKADDLMRLTCLNDLALTRIDELDASLGGN